MVFTIHTDAVWVTYEPGIEGEYLLGGMLRLYDSTVDKGIYPSFDCWLWDMERSGTFYRHAR